VNIKFQYPIRELLEAASKGSYTQIQLQELHTICLAIARQLVRRKVASGRLRLAAVGLSEEDVARDCIADLFARDGHNRLREIKKFIETQELSLNELSEEMSFIQLRGLVFGVASNNFFRIHNEVDPGAGKIIRNLKIAVGKSSRCKLVSVFDEHFIEVVTDEQLPGCRSIDADELESEVQRIVARVEDIPSLLNQVVEFLSEQTTFRRWVKLTPLAVAAKNAFERLRIVEFEDEALPDSLLLQVDARTIIAKSCEEIKTEMKPRYLAKGKVGGTTFDNYMLAIDELLCCQFLHGMDGDVSPYECFVKFNPAIRHDEYVARHRTVFEYLVKLTRQRALKRLRKL
jgi:hypothetical protein